MGHIHSWIQALYVILFLACLPFFAFAQESISLFESTITLREDGTFGVQEQITYDVGGEDRRGIYRFITKQHPQDAGVFWKDRAIEITLNEVEMDGQPYPYVVTDSNGVFEVKIGDPDVYIEGEHTFLISYDVSGGYSYFEDGSAEVYWNVTGSGWNMPIENAVAYLEAPVDMLREPSFCYAGSESSTLSCEELASTQTRAVYSHTGLQSNEGLTIAHAVDGSRVAQVIHERLNIFPFLLLLTVLFLSWIGFITYRQKTAHRFVGPVIAQYEPYKAFKPMYAGMLQDGRLDPHDITAGIVYLAEQGFLKITKTEQKVLFLFEVDDYSVELLRPIAEAPDRSSKDTLELLFSKDAPVGTVVSLKDLSKDTAKQQQNLVLLQKIRTDIKKDMHADGFLEKKKGRFTKVVSFFGILIVTLLLASVYTPTALILVGVASVCLLIVVIVLYERKTKEGYVAQNHLEGFKLFLSVTDAKRFTFHNAPEKSPEQFMEYLPYAIAFGVEKQWAEVFKDMTILTPSWYASNTGGSFAPASFATSMSAFSSSLSSASSSSGSGSGGGGSSGGGGGGGGGGGW